MAKCYRNDVGSIVLDRNPVTVGNHFRLWRSTFRRKIFAAVSCGGGSCRRQELWEEDDVFVAETSAIQTIGDALNSLSFRERPRSVEGEKKKQAESGDGGVKKKKTAERLLKQGKSEKLSDLLSIAEVEADVETKKKEEALEDLKRVVRDLQIETARVGHGGDASSEKKLTAATKVRLFAKEDSEARVTLALLGAIPPLVGMIDDSEVTDAQIASLYALLNLAIGNDANKAAIVKAGSVHKMLKLLASPSTPKSAVSEAIVANFLGLSALDSNKPIIGSSGAIPFLVLTLKNLDEKSSSQATEDALRALYNLSIHQPNIPFILETDLIGFLMAALGGMEVSERILSILSNVVSAPEGRKAISSVSDAFTILVDVLSWNDAPGCQEKASYILMVMAHKAYNDKQRMIEAGIVSSLLELTLIGTTLTQKRASRMLECLRVDKGKQVSGNQNSCSGLSAPIYGSSSSSFVANSVSKESLADDDDMMSEEKKAVKQLVQQSLQTNMRRIVKRANLPQDFVPSEHFKSLTGSSTSKSLPF